MHWQYRYDKIFFMAVIRMKNMTEGNVTKLIINFAIPVLLGNIFQQFYTMADTDGRKNI